MRRWKVDTHSKLDSVLMLSSVNLPGGELVRNFGIELHFMIYKMSCHFLARPHEVEKSYCRHHGRPRSCSRSSAVTFYMQVVHKSIS